jgi:hypothetical protein
MSEMNPRVVDNDAGEITVELAGRELRGWSYANDSERRAKMLAAREYVEGWSDARRSAVSARPVAWFCFVDAPKDDPEPLRIRAWTTDAERAKSIGQVIGRELEPLYRALPQSLPLRGPDCACCEQRPRKDCTVPGCTMKDAGWALERSQAVSAK